MALTLYVLLVVNKRELETQPVPTSVPREAVISSTGRRYVFDPLSVEQDVGDGEVVRPLSVPPGDPGRWVPIDLLFRARGTPGGRLTLSSGTPVLTTDVLSVTKTFYTPYLHDLIPIYTGNTWSVKQFRELSNDTTEAATGAAGPAVVVADSNYDLFVWDDAGTLRLTRGPAWTTDIARSAGTAIVRVGGTLLNQVAIANGPAAQRGTYVGTIRAGTGAVLFWKLGGKAVGGSSGYFNVWNMYNRVEVQAQSRESTVSWTYAGATFAWRPINATTNNRVSFVTGLNEDPVEASYSCNGAIAVVYVGIGLDSGTVRSGSSFFRTDSDATIGSLGFVKGETRLNLLGFHFLQAIEFNNSNIFFTAIFWGDVGIPLIAQNGLFFRGMF